MQGIGAFIQKRQILHANKIEVIKISDTMPRTFQAQFPSIEKQVRALATRMRTARLRRRITTVQFAERVGISRDTLHRLESGDPHIAFGTYMRALRVLGLEKDMDAVASDDVLGRKLQDLALVSSRTRRSASPAMAPPAHGEED